jgi:hypothetical protein
VLRSELGEERSGKLEKLVEEGARRDFWLEIPNEITMGNQNFVRCCSLLNVRL